MNLDIIFIGLFFFILGILIAYIAPKIGPNLILGVRWGYTLSDKRVWDKVNRLTGHLMALVGGLTIVFGFFELIDIVIVVLYVTVASLLIALFSFMVSKRYAEYYLSYYDEREGEIKPLEPFKLKFIEYVFLVLPFSLSTLILFHMFVNELEREFVTTFAFATFGLFLFTVLIIWVGINHPIVFHSGLLKKRWGRDIVYKLIIYGLIAAQIVLTLTVINIYYYALTTQFLVPIQLFTPLIIIIVFSPFLLIIKRWKTYNRSNKFNT